MSQDSENWSLLQELFHLAETTPEAERERVLYGRCGDERLVRRALEILRSSVVLDEEEPAATPGAAAGRIGPYTLIRLLGSGGIGSVWLAERILGGAPQRVALKMLAPHAAGPSFVERFHREQHILGSLDHPHITRMIDGGVTEAGQPYLVMEYVEGEHLDVWCDAQKLGIAERLRLFLQVCDAVDYAHRNLIVHLDLKPSNIMVTREGEVKLLDFGTSKLILNESPMTTTVLATPAYASPEQLRNEPVTTACDVYSLGAILSELLAGKRSARRTSAAVLLERALTGQEPDRLENCITPEAAPLRGTTEPKLRQALKGDLSVITAKCERANPAERYRSVEAVAEDIRRYQSGRTVLATPQTLSYQLAKFLRRNRKLVTVSALAFVVLAGALGYAVLRQREALRQAQRAVQMQTLMTQLFRMANVQYMNQPAATVPQFLKLGVTILPQIIRDPADQRAATLSLAESMYFDEDYQEALTVLQGVIERAKAAGDLAAEAEAEGFAGRAAYRMGRVKEATPLSAHAMLLSGVSGISPPTRLWIKTFYNQDRYELGHDTEADTVTQRAALREAASSGVADNERAYATIVLGLLVSKRGSLREFQNLIESAIAVYKSEPYAACDLAIAERIDADLHRQIGDADGSVALFRASWDGIRRCKGDNNNDALIGAGYLGEALAQDGQPRQAISLLEDTLPRLRQVAGNDSFFLYNSMIGLARAYVAVGRYSDAEHMAEQLSGVIAGKFAANAPPMGSCQLVWAQALAGEGRTDEALAHARVADATFTGGKSKVPSTIAVAAAAHQLVLDLEAKLKAKAS